MYRKSSLYAQWNLFRDLQYFIRIGRDKNFFQTNMLYE